MSSFNNPIQWEEKLKSNIKQRPRIGTTHLVKDGKYRTPSMFNPTLEVLIISKKIYNMTFLSLLLKTFTRNFR